MYSTYEDIFKIYPKKGNRPGHDVFVVASSARKNYRYNIRSHREK